MDRRSDTRLRAIKQLWSNYQITQQQAAVKMELTQPALNQYLTGKTKLNTDIIIKFARLFNISPAEIDPNLYWDWL